MKYLLSNLEVTESVTDYILDLIKVYFVVEKRQTPHLNIGVHKVIGTANRTSAIDIVAMDVSNFITLLSNQGISVSIKSINLVGDTFEISLMYENESINFTLE